METTAAEEQAIGVVVVTYGAEAFVADCLASLLASGYLALSVVVVDNASPDATLDRVRRWAGEALAGDWEERGPGAPREPARHWLTLLETGGNLGFAGGVNAGLRMLAEDPELTLFWVLNPDATVEPQTPSALARRARVAGRFAAIGGRILYAGSEGLIQTDGGRLHRLGFTGVNVNRGAPADACAMPDPDTLDYISGASVLVSREFLERAGPMDESWFLYYEEIDWQLRRGDLPLAVEPDARVLHRAGASIGSGRPDERASPFAVYFMTRNLLPFVARWSPARLPLAYAIAWWKLLRSWGADGARLAAFLRGLHRLAPPRAVRERLPAAVWERIHGRRRGRAGGNGRQAFFHERRGGRPNLDHPGVSGSVPVDSRSETANRAGSG